jgi:hypothetical protein
MSGTTAKPIVLIATTDRWVPTARLAMALAKAGFVVKAICPSNHPLVHTSVVSRFHDYRGLAPLSSFTKAITTAQPAIIIPGDDLATRHLHEIYAREKNKNSGSPICNLIATSLGAPENFPLSFSRSGFINRALQEGVRAPKTKVLKNSDHLDRWISTVGLPVVLKADGTSGGDGVKIARTKEEVQRAFRKLNAPPLLARAIKRSLVDHDSTLVWPALRRQKPGINAQEYVTGREATTAVACWKGKVLASLHFEVLQKSDSAGPATVLRLIENADMDHAAKTMVASLNLSGFHGFDFMLRENSNEAWLIETNPRATQAGHLTLGPDHDLPAALLSALTGQPIKSAPALTEKNTFALFPRELIRDPNSEFIRSGYHDLPTDEPAFVEFCMQKVPKRG